MCYPSVLVVRVCAYDRTIANLEIFGEFNTHDKGDIAGIFDEYMLKHVKAKNIDICPDIVRQGGLAVARKIESLYADRSYAYQYLTRNIDYFFDEQKRKGMQLFWDEGLKASLRANPG